MSTSAWPLLVLLMTSLTISLAKNTTNGDKTTTKCILSAHGGFQDDLKRHMSEGAILVELHLSLKKPQSDGQPEWSRSLYKPYSWVRSTGMTGQQLLTLDESYSFMSLFTLSTGVVSLEVDVTESPTSCLQRETPQEAVTLIRRSIMNSFTNPDAGDVKFSLGEGEQICNMHVVDDEGYARFQYQCCHSNDKGRMVCHEIATSYWIGVVLSGVLIVTKIVVILFSPLLLPGWLYRHKYKASEYIYHVPDDPVTVKVVVTQDPSLYGEENANKRVRLSDLEHMAYFRAMISSNRWQQDRLYELKVKDCRLSVSSRRLLGEYQVPVSLTTLLYNNLVRCRIRKLAPFQACCQTSVLGSVFHSRPHQASMTWKHCMQLVARCCLLLILLVPWLFRLVIYWTYEMDIMDDRSRMARDMGLNLDPNSNFRFIAPVHGLFLFTFIIIFIELVVYGFLSPSWKGKITKVIRQCLSNMRDRSRMTIVSWLAELIVRPLTVCGVLGCVFFPLYVVIILVVTLPIIVFYLVPSINLTIRLLIHAILFLCPNAIQSKIISCCRTVNGSKKKLRLSQVTSNEDFIQRQTCSCGEIVLQLLVIVTWLLSFWCATFLVMELFSFYVEMIFYLTLGLLVNAKLNLHLTALEFLIFLYLQRALNTVTSIYLHYHKSIHTVLTSMKQKEMDAMVSKEDDNGQENTAFALVGRLTSKQQPNSRPVLVVKNEIPVWRTSGMLVLMDHTDRKYTPEKFFHCVVDLNCYGCPGPIYRHVTKALWEFAWILVFLLVLYIAVLTFGNAYLSSTNQLLATIAVGLIPYFCRSKEIVESVNVSSVHFQTALHKAINGYQQHWPAFDVVPVDVNEVGAPLATDGNGAANGTTTDMAHSSRDTAYRDTPGQDGNHRGSHGAIVRRSTANVDAYEVGDMGDPGSNPRNEFGLLHSSSSQLSEEKEDEFNVDIIIDVSTPSTRSSSFIRKKDGFDMGSFHMLDKNWKWEDEAREDHRASREIEEV